MINSLLSSDKQSQSSLRFIFILIGLIVGLSILGINIAFISSLSRFSGFEITQIIIANTTLLITLIYGKNKAKEIETTTNNGY